MQGTLVCILMKREELRSSFLSLAGEQAGVQMVTSLLAGAEAGFQDGHLPSTQEGVVKEGPQRMWHTLSWVSRLSRIFQVSEVVREWREANYMQNMGCF